MPYAEFHYVHLIHSSVKLENIWREAGIEGVGSRGSICYYICYVLNESHTIGLDESRFIYLPRLVQRGRQGDCHFPSIVLSSLVPTFIHIHLGKRRSSH